MLQIDPMTASDALELERDIQPGDAAELAAAGLTAPAALELAHGWALRDGDILLALFGVQDLPGSEGVGVPWLLCTNQLRRLSRRQVMLMARNFILSAQGSFTQLQNLVHRHNDQAIRLVQWLGFTVDAEPTGPGNNFRLFHWSKPDV